MELGEVGKRGQNGGDGCNTNVFLKTKGWKDATVLVVLNICYFHPETLGK